jgi:predicted transcriptional regulator
MRHHNHAHRSRVTGTARLRHGPSPNVGYRAGVYRPERPERELVALRFIATGPVTVNDLVAHYGHKSKSVATKVIECLVEEGLVTTARLGQRAPRTLYLTEAGRELLAREETS